MASEQVIGDDSSSSHRTTTQSEVQGEHIPKLPVEKHLRVGSTMFLEQQNLESVRNEEEPACYGKAPNRPISDTQVRTMEHDDVARPLQTAFADMSFSALSGSSRSLFQAYSLQPAPVLPYTNSYMADVQRGPADKASVTTAANNTTVALLPSVAFNSPLLTDDHDESQPALYSVAHMPSKTQVISVADHPSQSASVEAINHADREECNSNESDCDNWSFISGSTRVGQKKTVDGPSPVPLEQIPLSVPNCGIPELVSESSIGNTVKYTTTISSPVPKVKTPSHSLSPESIAAAETSNERSRECATSEISRTHSTPKPATAIGEEDSASTISKLPASQTDSISLAVEPAATLDYHGSPPTPDAVVDPLDSSSRGLIEMVCATVNSKWPILARYFCLPEDCVAGIKEQDAKAEGRCWVLLLRLSNKGVTWKTLYEELLNRLHLNILACRIAQIIGLPKPDGEAVISRLNQIVIDIHNSTHKLVLLQLSQTASEHWKRLAEILQFDQCTDADSVHQIMYTSKDADECCCEMLLQWIAWRQTQAQSASPGALPVTYGELFTRTEAAISGTEVEKVVQAAMCVL